MKSNNIALVLIALAVLSLGLMGGPADLPMTNAEIQISAQEIKQDVESYESQRQLYVKLHSQQ